MKAQAPGWPIAVVAVFIIAANVVFVWHRLFLPYPISPWEAGLVVEAARLTQGLPVYGAVQDHATTMYGPMQTLSLAGIFKFSGISLLAGRLINVFAGIAIVLLLALSFAQRTWLSLVVSIALLLSVNGWTGYYFVETRPDMVSALWAIAGLFVLYRSMSAASAASQVALALAGSALVLVGAMYKQTALAFVGLPLIAELIGRSSWRRLVVALIPPVLGLIGLFALSLSPPLWHFMVAVPAQYRISPTAFVDGGVVLLSLPFIVIAVLQWLLTDARDNWHTPLARWLVASLVCAVPVSLAALAKEGGTQNSMIPALLAIGAFCSWRTAVALGLLHGSDTRPALRFAAGALLAVALLRHAFPSPAPLSTQMYNRGHGMPEYAAVVDAVRKLPGKVVSFDDPWITLAAKGYAGATMVFEADAVRWNANRTQALRREFSSADYVVSIRGGSVYGDPDWWPKEQALLESGFVRVEMPNVATSVYQLWRRDRR